MLFAALLTAFAHCSTIIAFYVVAPFLGATAYGYAPLLVGMYTKASGVHLAGAAGGFVNTVWSIGSFVGPAVIGYVYGQTHSLNTTLAAIAVGPVLAAVLMFFLVERASLGEA